MKKFLKNISFAVGIIGIIIGASMSTFFRVYALDDARGSRDDESAESTEWLVPEVFIKAINPGYNEEGVANVGEMVEIGRKNADAPILLAGLTISYTNSSGNQAVLVEFPENTWMVGESILLRLASSPGSELANLVYSKTLAFKAGPLELRRGDEVIDAVCWNSKDGCMKEFKSAAPTTIVRDLETGEFRHEASYEPVFDKNAYLVETEDGSGNKVGDGGGWGNDSDENSDSDVGDSKVDDDLGNGDSGADKKDGAEAAVGDGADEAGEGGKGSSTAEEMGDQAAEAGRRCNGLEFSEILSYYEESQSEQFIELHNAAAEQILLDGCQIRYKNKYYPLSGIMKSDEYKARYLDDFKITKNPNNYNTLELIDVSGAVVDKLEYPNGQRKGTAYAKIGYDANGDELWRVTYAVTPGEPNNYQEYKNCEDGKVINKETGNCVKVAAVSEKICADGQYLNPLTGRCKKIEAEKTSKVCAEGQYLNILTGRCKKIAVAKAVTECKDGYYLNEETGRCRKIQENKGAEYEIETEEYEEKSSFVALYAIIGVVLVGVGVVCFEFRHEIAKLLRRVWRRSR